MYSRFNTPPGCRHFCDLHATPPPLHPKECVGWFGEIADTEYTTHEACTGWVAVCVKRCRYQERISKTPLLGAVNNITHGKYQSVPSGGYISTTRRTHHTASRSVKAWLAVFCVVRLFQGGPFWVLNGFRLPPLKEPAPFGNQKPENNGGI